MRKSQLSDRQLEQILGQMPKIKDHRDSRDIYQNIAHRVEKRKMPGWVIPGAALAAVLFLTFILSSGLIGGNYSQEKSMDSSSASGDKSSVEMNTAVRDDAAEESAKKQENTLKMDTADSEKEEGNEFAALDKQNPYAGMISLYPEEIDIETSEFLTYAIPDNQGMTVVPVTVTKQKEYGKNWIDIYTETMPKLKETEWGLTDYYPLDATWSYDAKSKTLNLDVKQNHPYRNGSSANDMFVESMTQNFSRVGIQRMLLTTEGEPGIDLGSYGSMTELPISAETLSKRAYLFLKVEGMPNPYLVPTKEQHKTIGEAFAQMRKGKGYLSASLPDDFKLENTKNNNKVLEITLGENTTLDEAFLPNLEAILMTASEFDYSGVKFMNANIDNLGPFNLKEVLPLPLAPNKQNIE